MLPVLRPRSLASLGSGRAGRRTRRPL